MKMSNLVFWAPRILTILFAAFLSIFALDVFSEQRGLWKLVGSLLLHLIPTAVILLFLALAWRRDWLGVLFYTGLGVMYIVTAWGRFPISVYFTISGPLFVMGLLFLASWRQRTSP